MEAKRCTVPCKITDACTVYMYISKEEKRDSKILTGCRIHFCIPYPGRLCSRDLCGRFWRSLIMARAMGTLSTSLSSAMFFLTNLCSSSLFSCKNHAGLTTMKLWYSVCGKHETCFQINKHHCTLVFESISMIYTCLTRKPEYVR